MKPRISWRRQKCVANLQTWVKSLDEIAEPAELSYVLRATTRLFSSVSRSKSFVKGFMDAVKSLFKSDAAQKLIDELPQILNPLAKTLESSSFVKLAKTNDGKLGVYAIQEGIDDVVEIARFEDDKLIIKTNVFSNNTDEVVAKVTNNVPVTDANGNTLSDVTFTVNVKGEVRIVGTLAAFQDVTYLDNGVETTGDLNVVQRGDDVGVRMVNKVGTYTTKIKWGIHNVDARPFGTKGYWGRRIKQNNPRVESYELKINPNNESFYVEHPNGGFVQFENLDSGWLQDGKLILQPNNSFYHVYDKPPFLRQKVLDEALRQVEAANAKDLKVEWIVSDYKALNQLTKFFTENNINIVIKYLAE